MTINQKLARFAETIKMSAICRRSGVGRSSISGIIRHGAKPTYDKAVAIARSLEVNIEWFLDDTRGWPPVYDRKEQPQHHESPAA